MANTPYIQTQQASRLMWSAKPGPTNGEWWLYDGEGRTLASFTSRATAYAVANAHNNSVVAMARAVDAARAELDALTERANQVRAELENARRQNGGA